MSNIPLNAQKLIEQSEKLIQQQEQKQQIEKEQRLSKAPVAFSKTTIIQQPTPIPPKDITASHIERKAAMELLMADKQYSNEELQKNQQVLLDQQKKSIIDKSLHSFFLGNVPQLNQHQFANDPVGYSQQVLQQAAPSESFKQSHSVLSSKVKDEQDFKIVTRTLFKSIEVFKQLISTPLAEGASIFSAALRGFQASDFLVSDIIEATRQDSQEICSALLLLKEGYRQMFSDQKAGEYLLMADIGRLRQELYMTQLKYQELKTHSVNVIHQIDENHKKDVENFKNTIMKIEQQRHTEVKQAMQKAKEQSEQVKTLRALLDTIKQDQQVQRLEQLRNQLAEREATIEQLRTTVDQKTMLYEKVMVDFNELQTNNQDNIERLNSLHKQIRNMEGQKDFCRNCEQKIYERAQGLTSDIREKLDRIEHIVLQVKILDNTIDSESELLTQTLMGFLKLNDEDQKVINLDYAKIMKQLLILEGKFQKLPNFQKLLDENDRKDQEILKYQLMEKEFNALRKIYKNIISKSTDDLQQQSSGTQKIGSKSDGSGAVEANQQLISENKLTLLRCQPLFLLIPKAFPIKIVSLYNNDEVSIEQVLFLQKNQLNTSVEFVQVVIHLFLVFLVQNGIQQQNIMANKMQCQLKPSAGGQFLPFCEPICALFVGWVHSQYQSIQNESAKQDAEVLINKVAFVLNAINDPTDDTVKIDDDQMYLLLGNLLFNSPLNSDEAQFLVFCYGLAFGGFPLYQYKKKQMSKMTEVTFDQDSIYQVGLPDLPVYVRPPVTYISLRRAIAITTLVLNKAVLKGYFEKFITQGKATDMIKDVPIKDVKRYNIIDCLDDLLLQQLDQHNEFYNDINEQHQKIQKEPSFITIIQIPFFVISLVKAYKAEVLVRLESLRIMYAASLIEANQRDQQMSTALKYRIVSDIITTINPLTTKTLVDCAFLDTVWRSPSALWAILIDSCRVRGIFANGLMLPPFDCVMQVVGGYSKQQKKYDHDYLFSKFNTFVRTLKPLTQFLSIFNCQQYQIFSLQVNTISNSTITKSSLQPIINMLKTILMDLINTLFSNIYSQGSDVSQICVTHPVILQNSIDLLQKQRLPCEILIDVMPHLVNVIKSLLGWNETDKQEPSKSPKKKK